MTPLALCCRLPKAVVAYPCCGPTAEKIGFRLGGAVSTKINASYFLQTALVRFADGRKEYNHTHIPTSVVVYESTDLVQWDYLATMANADDFPESEEGKCEARETAVAKREKRQSQRRPSESA